MDSVHLSPSPESQTVHHHRPRRKAPWIVLAVLILLPLGFLGWTGVWNIPVVSAIFGTNKPIDLGIRPTAADLAQAQADNPMTFVNPPGTWSGLLVKKYSGTVPIDDQNTSAEVTAFIQHLHAETNVRDIQVKYNEGGLEVSGFVIPKIKAPAYANVGITRTSPTTVVIDVRNVKIGRLTVPSQYYDDISREATAWVNARLAEVPGLSIDVLEYHADAAVLKGTLPESIEQTADEYTILGKRVSEL